MKVSYDEGQANHIGLEPCIVFREERNEASAEEGTGQPLSLESIEHRMPTRSLTWKAIRQREGTLTLCWFGGVGEPGTHKSSLHGNREISWLTTGRKAVWSRAGRRGAVAADE